MATMQEISVCVAGLEKCGPALLRDVAAPEDGRTPLSIRAAGAFVRVFLAALLGLLATPAARSQSFTVGTLAGNAGQGSNDGTGSSVRFNSPGGVAVDSAGNIYVADTANHTIRKITSGGAVSTLAGLAGLSGSADGSGSSARFNQPLGIAVDINGTVYVADTGNHTIRKITSGGVVSTLAGSAGNSGSLNATGTNALFYEPEGVAVNSTGTLIFVADTWNHMIRQITSNGIVSTLAGSAGTSGTNNGTGTGALFYQPQGVTVDVLGNVYVADTANATIRMITAGGVVTTLAGSPGVYGSANGSGTAAQFYQPSSVSVDTNGNIFVADTLNHMVRMVTSGGTVSTLAGAAGVYGSANGASGTARFYLPQGIAVSGTNVYVADTGNGTIRQLSSSSGVVTTLAGSPSVGSVDGLGTAALFAWPQGAAIDSGGNIYVGDTYNHTIREVTPAGLVSTFAGSAGASGTNDGSGGGARFYGPQGVSIDTGGTLFVADTANHTIRKVTSGGSVSTFAGTAGSSGVTDATGLAAQFNGPQAVAIASSGVAYVADTGNHTIRKITAAGVTTTFAGVAGSAGSIDGTSPGDGTNIAHFFSPSGIAVDSGGNVFVADTGNHTIRKITSGGAVSTIAGLPGVWGNSDGTNRAARFFQPRGLTVDSSGNVFVLDSGNHTIRMLTLSGTNWVVSTVAGQPDVGGFADGSGSAAQFYYPGGIGVNASGLFGVADSGNSVVRSGTNGLTSPALPPVITNQPQSLTVTQAVNATFAVGASGTPPLSYQWLFSGTNIPGANGSSYTRSNAQPSDAGDYIVIVSNSAGSATSSPPATLTVIPVPTPPTINVQPGNQTVAQGQNANFSVSASGSMPLYYQWVFAGTNISGATDSTYTRFSAQPVDAGAYSVIVSNLVDVATSSNANLTIIVPPLISVQPTNQLVTISNSVTFSVGVSQGTSPKYQWLKNGSAIVGATLSSYSRASVTWSDAATYSVIVSNFASSQTSSNAVLTVQQALLYFFEGFEAYNRGGLDKNQNNATNAGAANPWWGINSTTNGWVTNSSAGVPPHGGSQMLGTAPGQSLRQDYYNLIYRLNAGQVYYGNFMCDWWFYDPFGTTSSATNSQDYLAIAQYAPVSTTADFDTPSFTTFSQRMSLGTFNSVGYNYSNYQARIVGATGGFNGNGWFNTTTIRSIGWHHARMVVGIPGVGNFAPVWMYVDNMTNATFSYPSTGVAVGFNLIELNHSMSKVGYGGYYDDLTFRAANDPWIVEQPVSQTVDPGQGVLFNTVAIGTAYQWQFNGTNIGGATGSSYSIASAGAADAGNYSCLINGANGTITTSNAVLTLNGPPLPGHFDSISVLGDGSVQLSMSGSANTNYLLQAATNLPAWSSLILLPSGNGSFQYNDASATNTSQRFYRLKLGP
jgi:sugar lactone lactonase YvrE